MCSNTPHSHTCTPWPMADCSFPHHKPPESYQACGLIHRKPLSCKRFVSFTDGFCTARTCPAPHHETNVLHSIHSPVHFHLRQHHDCDVEITVFDCIGLQQARLPLVEHAHAGRFAQRLRHFTTRRTRDRTCGARHRNQQRIGASGVCVARQP